MFRKTSGSNTTVDIGELASTYVFVREIGRGGMGTVIVAKHRSAGHFVAIKIATPDKVDPEVLARLTREARLMARLQHPNIVKLYDVRPIGGGRVGIVMEFIRGQSLADLLNARRKLPFATCMSILRDVGRALSHAHAGGVIHLDVKPANVLIETESGTARLSDFGIARGAGEVSDVTAAGAVVGTPAYMSPEQIDGQELDVRSDIYALGVLGWQLVSGEQPWAGEQLFKLLYKQKHEQLPSLRDMRRDVPAGLLLAIEGALEKDRAHRWLRVDDMIEQLGSAQPTRANVARRALRAAEPAATSEVGQQETIAIYRPRVLRNVSDSRSADTIQLSDAEEVSTADASDVVVPVQPAAAEARRPWRPSRQVVAGTAITISVAFLLFNQLSSGADSSEVVPADSVVVAPGAVESSPRDSVAVQAATPLVHEGRADERVDDLLAPPDSAAPLPPSPNPTAAREIATMAMRARMLVFSNDTLLAIPIIDSALARDQRNGDAYILRARVRIARGDVRDAWTDIEMAARTGRPWEAVALSALLNVRVSGAAMAREQLEESLRSALNPRRRLDPGHAVGLATALVMTGDTSTALTLLELAERTPELPRLLGDPLLLPLRSSQRFSRVLLTNIQ